jgi:subtilisin family serine protease
MTPRTDDRRSAREPVRSSLLVLVLGLMTLGVPVDARQVLECLNEPLPDWIPPLPHDGSGDEPVAVCWGQTTLPSGLGQDTGQDLAAVIWRVAGEAGDDAAGRRIVTFHRRSAAEGSTASDVDPAVVELAQALTESCSDQDVMAVADELIIRIENPQQEELLRSDLRQEFGLVLPTVIDPRDQAVAAGGSRFVRFRLPRSQDELSLISVLAGLRPRYEVELNFMYRFEPVEVAPCDQPGEGGHWGLEQVGAASLEPNLTASEVVIGVLDSGISVGSRELERRLWSATVDGTLRHGKRFGDCGEDCWDVTDAKGHGTQVAAVIAAERNEDLVRGVLPRGDSPPIIRLQTLRVDFPDDVGLNATTAFNVSKALEYVREEEVVHVLNASFGGTCRSSAMGQMLVDLGRRGTVLVVASAGNDGVNLVEKRHFPASFAWVDPGKFDHLLVVGGTNSDDEKWGGSNSGSNFGVHEGNIAVHLGAPATEIRTLKCCGGPPGRCSTPCDRDTCGTGTSLAAPFATAAAALLLNKHPHLTARKLRDSLIESATFVEALCREWGGRRLDIRAALSTTPTSLAGANVEPHTSCNAQP